MKLCRSADHTEAMNGRPPRYELWASDETLSVVVCLIARRYVSVIRHHENPQRMSI